MSKSEKLEWMKWYPSYWLKDPCVRSLTPMERFAWFEVLMLMFECERRGYLMIGGRAPTNDELARMIGQITPEQAGQLVKAFVAKRVADIDQETGCIVSRRMINQEAQRLYMNEHGRAGGNPNLMVRHEPGFIYIAAIVSTHLFVVGKSNDPKTRVRVLRSRDWVKDEIMRASTKDGLSASTEGRLISLTLVDARNVDDMSKAEEQAVAYCEQTFEKQGKWYVMPQRARDNPASLMDEILPPAVGCHAKRAHLFLSEVDAHAPKSVDLFPPFEWEKSFDEFWRAYPLRAGKVDARKAWEKAIRREGAQIGFDAAHEKILNAAVEYADFLNTANNPPKAKHPQGWLNSARYDDDLSGLRDMDRRQGPQRAPGIAQTGFLDTPAQRRSANTKAALEQFLQRHSETEFEEVEDDQIPI